MKSKDLQKVVLSKCQNSDRPSKIFQDLNGAISHNQVFVWCRMIDATGCINVLGCPKSSCNSYIARW